MSRRIDIRGVLVPNDYKWFYDWLGEDCTCPRDVQNVLDSLEEGESVDVYINSPGGVIDVGSEIYTALKMHADHVNIYITGEACSAASIVAMAAHCEMSPTALMMVHCVSTFVSGNHNDLEHTANVLQTADHALCQAYVIKTGMSEEEAIAMMEEETWLTAAQALEKGLIDGIMLQDQTEEKEALVAGPMFKLPTEEQMNSVRKMIEAKQEEDALADALSYSKEKTLRNKLQYLALKGGEQ